MKEHRFCAFCVCVYMEAMKTIRKTQTDFKVGRFRNATELVYVYMRKMLKLGNSHVTTFARVHVHVRTLTAHELHVHVCIELS